MDVINNTIIIGRLTRDVDLSYTSGQNQTALAKMAIANNSGTKQKPEVSYFDIIVWGKFAELCKNYLKKGSRCIVSGSLKQDRWQDRNGNNQSKVVIVAKTVQFVDPPQKTGNYPQDQGSQGQYGHPAQPPQNPPAQQNTPNQTNTQADTDLFSDEFDFGPEQPF